MVPPARKQYDGSHPTMYIVDAYAGFFPDAQAAVASPRPIQVRVPEDALNGAKGAVAALGVEFASAIFLFGAWLIWHLIR
jgi:hypothetical protein